MQNHFRSRDKVSNIALTDITLMSLLQYLITITKNILNLKPNIIIDGLKLLHNKFDAICINNATDW